MTHALILRETTLGRLALLLACGKRPRILAVLPLIPGARGLLRKLSAWLVARGLAIDPESNRPEFGGAGGIKDLRRSVNHFGLAEPWMRSQFQFDAADSRLGEYATPYKHIVSNQVDQRAFLAWTIHAIAARDGAATFYGVPADIKDCYRRHFGALPATLHGAGDFKALLAVAFALGVTAWAVAAVALRTRLWRIRLEDVFFGIDYVSDPRDWILWDELDDAPGERMIVFRSEHERRQAAGKIGPRRSCSNDDVRFTPSQAMLGLAKVVGEIIKLLPMMLALPPEISWDVSKLPYKRLMCRALLWRYRFRNFYGRDDYNVEHIIRSQELRRIGSRHFGRLHGIPAYPPVLPMIRYIDFDVYYEFGSDFARFYADTWPRAMRRKPVGSFGMTRSQLHDLARPRPLNIIYFFKPSFQDDQVLDGIAEIARAFPGRRIYFKPKGQIRGGPLRAKVDRMLAKAPGNIIETNDDTYDLVFHAQYALSDPSSTIAECIQFGLYSFAARFSPEWKDLYFCAFDGLCLPSAAAFVERVRGIEAGTYRFPREHFSGLIDLSGKVVWDALREDLGLPAREPSPLRHLDFLAETQRQPKAVAAGAGVA